MYRQWNVYYDPFHEPRHFAAPWVLVDAFLREHGYSLDTRIPRSGPITAGDLLYEQSQRSYQEIVRAFDWRALHRCTNQDIGNAHVPRKGQIWSTGSYKVSLSNLLRIQSLANSEPAAARRSYAKPDYASHRRPIFQARF